MCMRIDLEPMEATMAMRWRGPAYDLAALREGWVLNECHGFKHGPLQVQCVEDAAASQAAWSLALRRAGAGLGSGRLGAGA